MNGRLKPRKRRKVKETCENVGFPCGLGYWLPLAETPFFASIGGEMTRRRVKLYSGPKSDHFDGEHFFDPDGAPPKALRELLRWQFGSSRNRARQNVLA